MPWQQTPYTLPVVIAALVSLGVAWMAWRNRETPGARSLVGLLLSGTWWALVVTIGLASMDLGTKIVASQLAYFGIALVPVTWLTFAIEYTGRGQSLLSERNVIGLLVIPAVTVGLAFTNGAHGLIWSSVSLTNVGSLTVIGVEHGPWFWLWAAYAYLLMGTGTYLVFRMAINSKSLYRGQVAALFVAVSVPWLLNAGYLTGVLPTPLDPTPYGFIVSGVVLAGAVFRQQLLDVVPVAREVARDEIIETMDDPVVVLDGQDQVVDLNEAATTLAGQRSDFIGEPVKAVIPPLAPVLEEGSDRSEIDLEFGDGSGHFDVRITDLDHGYGAVTGRLVTLRDITERKRREQQLERYETIIEASGDPVYTLDSDGCFTFVNERLEEVTGYAAEELIGNHVSILMDDAGVEAGRSVIDRLTGGPTCGPETFEFTVTTADDDRIRCEGHVALLPNDNGFRGTVGVVRDITERTERERRIEALHGATRELIKAKHPEDVAAATAEAVAETLGYQNAVVRLLNDDGTELQPVASTADAADSNPSYPIGEGPAGRAFEHGQAWVYDDVRTINDGIDRGDIRSAMYLPIGEYGTVSIGDQAVNAFDESDRRLVEILAAHAETALERVEREQEIQRQNERLEEFAGLVSHDLRNPLSVAMGRLALIEEEVESEYLPDVRDALTRMDELIDDVLTLARQGSTVVEPEPVPFDDVVSTAWGMTSTEAATLEVVDDIDEVVVDESRLSELLENLFRNAIEHGGDDVRIRVGAIGNGFYVEDTGPGIPASAREQVFESGYSGEDGGTGFGLAIVEEIAEAHGWSISVDEGTDGGARFEITGVERLEVA